MSTHEDEYLRVRVEARKIAEKHLYDLLHVISESSRRHQDEIANVIMRTRLAAFQEVLLELTNGPGADNTESFIAGTEWAMSKIRKLLEHKE